MIIEKPVTLLLNSIPQNVADFIYSIIKNDIKNIVKGRWTTFDTCQVYTDWAFKNIINLKFHAEHFNFTIT